MNLLFKRSRLPVRAAFRNFSCFFATALNSRVGEGGNSVKICRRRKREKKKHSSFLSVTKHSLIQTTNQSAKLFKFLCVGVCAEEREREGREKEAFKYFKRYKTQPNSDDEPKCKTILFFFFFFFKKILFMFLCVGVCAGEREREKEGTCKCIQTQGGPR